MTGLDLQLLNNLDFELANRRVEKDIATDFIFSPHYAAVFKHASDDLTNILSSRLRNGTYSTSSPITLEVLKRNGLTRPGSILAPLDRLLYQALIDSLSSKADNQINRNNVFSNRLLDSSIPEVREYGYMFTSSNNAFNDFNSKIRQLCKDNKFNFAIKTDVANHFERINQHFLINSLKSAGCQSGYVNLLEKMLETWSSSMSYSIPQGLWPSDFLGNFSLITLDSSLQIKGITSIRYMDDYYMFFKNEKSARLALVDLCFYIRSEGMNLNESKTAIFETKKLYKEETEFDNLYEKVKEKYRELIIEVGYGYEMEAFDSDEIDEAVIEQFEPDLLQDFYAKRENFPHLIEKIDIFCLPLLAEFELDSAVENSLSELSIRPYLARTYFRYLFTIAQNNPSVITKVERLYKDGLFIYEWQLLWLHSFFYSLENISHSTILKVCKDLTNPSLAPAVRAISALAIGKHGDASLRKVVRNYFSYEASLYVKEAILYATKYFSNTDEKSACQNTWAPHSEINTLIVQAIRNES